MSKIGQTAPVEAVSADPIVELNVALLRDRSAVGVGKYGVTLAGNKLPLRAWLAHALEEALDQANYLQRAMQEIDAGGERLAPAGASCTLPPEGWYCTRGAGHGGPCAARSVADPRLADYLVRAMKAATPSPAPVQPPAGELPALPDLPNFRWGNHEGALFNATEMESYAKEYGRLCLANCQPAPVADGLARIYGEAAAAETVRSFGEKSYQLGRAAGMEEAEKVCDNADKSAHPSDLAFAIRATIITGSA